MKYLFAVCLVLGAFQWTGCQTAGDSAVVRSAEDHELAGAVHRQLRAELVPDGVRIGVTVTDGVVTLRGTVRDRAAKARAMSIAEKVPGVVKVNNDLGL